jgi:hypothetical protein
MMNDAPMDFSNVSDKLFAEFPEFKRATWEEFSSYFDMELGDPEEMPGKYLVFEDVVKKRMFELLESGSDDAFLQRVFDFFERMASSEDVNVSRDLLGIAIMEPLVYRKEDLRKAWRFMGSKLKANAVWEADQQNRPENLPQ